VSIDLDKGAQDFEQTAINLDREILKDFIASIDFIPDESVLIIEQFRQMTALGGIFINDGVLINDGKMFLEP